MRIRTVQDAEAVTSFEVLEQRGSLRYRVGAVTPEWLWRQAPNVDLLAEALLWLELEDEDGRNPSPSPALPEAERVAAWRALLTGLPQVLVTAALQAIIRHAHQKPAPQPPRRRARAA